MTDAETRDALSDLAAVAITLFGEARGEPVEGRIAVGSVIRNRVLVPRRFGPSFRAVCHTRAQFSCWWKFGGAATYQLVYGLARASIAGGAAPVAGFELRVYQECLFLAEGVIEGQLLDRVRGATHYYNPAAMEPRGRVPDWAAGLTPVAKVHGHLFFSGVR